MKIDYDKLEERLSMIHDQADKARDNALMVMRMIAELKRDLDKTRLAEQELRQKGDF